MQFLDFMTRTNGSPIVYLLKALGLTFAGTVVIILVTMSFIPAPEDVSAAEPEQVSTFAMIIIWPLFATLLIWGAISGFKRISPTYWHAAAGSALVLAAIFGLLSDITVAVILAWPFFIYSLTFLAWQLKSTQYGFVMTAVLQGMVSIIPAMILASSPG